MLCPRLQDDQVGHFKALPGGLRVPNSDRWEYGMGLVHTSLPLWLSATLQGAGREGLTTEKKKVVGSGVLKLMVL